MEQEEKLQRQDFEFVLRHMQDEIDAKCDFNGLDLTVGEPFEHLKFTNVVNVFHYISRFTTDQFGPDITNAFQTFQVDGNVSGSAIAPTIIVAPPEVNPTSLIHQFVNIRCRPENFDALSLSNDPEVIKNARKSLLTAMNRGNWVLVHYSKPSRAAAGMLVDLFTQMSATSVNTNFRLMIVASLFQYIAPLMIGQSKRIQIDSFPLMRFAMSQMCHHDGSAIRSAANPRAMKKLAWLS
jgi:hypothetical protein